MISIRLRFIVLTGLFLFPAMFLQAQNGKTAALPEEKEFYSCPDSSLPCGTPSNIRLCFTTPLNWPDSLVYHDYYRVFMNPYNWDSRTTNTDSLVPVKIKRYRYFTSCPEVENGVFDLGEAGKLKFTKRDDWVEFSWLEKGVVGNFDLEVGNCGIPGKTSTIEVDDYIIHWFGKSPKIKNGN